MKYLAFLAAIFSAAGQTPVPAAAPAKDHAEATTLRDLSESLQELSRRVRTSVVQIFSTGYAAVEESEGSANASALLNKQHSTGSGVILSADGYIITNAHVVKGARRIQVRLPPSELELAGHHSTVDRGGRLFDARLVGQDRESDLAVLHIDHASLPHLNFGDSDNLKQGELVMAFGNPLGLEGSVSMGVVSSTSRQIKPDSTMIYIQTDAPINPGNSGGPLIDFEGKVVGINTFILSQSGGSEGLGFAIPSNAVKNAYEQIRKEGHVHRGRIGVYAQTITPVMASGLSLARDWGVVLADVEPDGPADKAGLQIGDIVLRLNGRRMESARQLEVNVYRYPKGQKVSLDIQRGSEALKVEVPVSEDREDPERFADMVNPEDNLVQRLGVLGIAIDKKLAEMLPELRKQYGIVVAAGSVSDFTNGTGLTQGDVIYSVNGSPVTSVPALKRKLEEFKSGETVVLQIQRSERLMYVAVELQ
jgi:serine protease Do